MSNESARATLRATTVEEIWSALGRNSPDEGDLLMAGLYLTGRDFWWASFRAESDESSSDDFDEVAQERPPGLEMVAIHAEPILNAEWFGYAMGDFNLQSWEITAYDLGDPFLYVVDQDSFNESRRLIAVGARTRLHDLFREVQLYWVEAIEWGSDAPTTLYAHGLHESFLVEAMARHSGAGAMELFKLNDEDSDGYARLHAFWRTAVTHEPSSATDALPPGLRGLASADYLRDKWQDREAFEGWLETVTLRWRDSGTELTPDDAESLVTVCTYLAAIGATGANTDE